MSFFFIPLYPRIIFLKTCFVQPFCLNVLSNSCCAFYLYVKWLVIMFFVVVEKLQIFEIRISEICKTKLARLKLKNDWELYIIYVCGSAKGWWNLLEDNKSKVLCLFKNNKIEKYFYLYHTCICYIYFFSGYGKIILSFYKTRIFWITHTLGKAFVIV